MSDNHDLFGQASPSYLRGNNQLPLPFTWKGDLAHTSEDFVVSQTNEAAVHYLESFALWPSPVTLLVGPRGSGRTTLAQRFAENSGGSFIDSADKHDQLSLFHSWNRAQDDKIPLLLISTEKVPDWKITIPDLATRLLGVPTIAIAAPDVILCAALIDTLLAKRGVAAPGFLGRYVAERIERSYAAIHAAVDTICVWLSAHDAKISLANVHTALVAGALFYPDTDKI